MGASIRIEGLNRHFTGADRPAVKALDLEVAEGETVCLVGPSGCGKSTTLRMVAGLDVPDGGSIRIADKDMRGVAPAERDVAMVFQGFALYPHMTARQIMEFPLKMRRVPAAERAKAVDEVADMLDIRRLLDRVPEQLSGGERQRVAMGRAIVRRPKVFLFDEPLSNLDAALRAELRVELGRLLRRLEATAIYVTHDQAEAMTLGNRIAVLRAGELEQVGPPRQIYEEPETRFVASFFGSPPMNLLEAERDGDSVRAGGIELPAPDGADGELVLGVRPEHLIVGDEGARATTVAVEPHGAESHVELELGEGLHLRARMPGFETPAPGDEVRIRFEPDHVRWFHAETGRAL